mgnify:FL=1
MDRKKFLQLLVVAAAGTSLPISELAISFPKNELITKAIPSTGKRVPVIGMGTWQTFDVGYNSGLMDARTEVLSEFFKRGGGVIDSSPMYGSSEKVLGYGLQKLDYPEALFSATKVWTRSAGEGKRQIKQSKKLWGLDTLDLQQVHNMVNWRAHLDTLFERKVRGEIKHVGVTTYGGFNHGQLERIMNNEPLDFIQVTYNARNRKAENRILPLAKEKGIAVIANRP